MPAYVILLLSLCSVSIAAPDQCARSHWDGLRVKWGLPGTQGIFNSMPRTTCKALQAGFVKVSECDGSASHRGARYVKDGDETLVLLFDINGYIAGIQTVLPRNLPNNYPDCDFTPFVDIEGNASLTAYFVQPDIICTTGRSQQDFDADGTGNVLYIQEGPNPDQDYMSVPLQEKNITPTKWIEGKYLKTMGMHYWYDLTKSSDCWRFYPVFLLYNDCKLDGFGWVLPVPQFSIHGEIPNLKKMNFVMKQVPDCLPKLKNAATMHIFFTSQPWLTKECNGTKPN